MAYADSPSGTTTSDTSDNGSIIDSDNDGDATEIGENNPTITAFAPMGASGNSTGCGKPYRET